jgi:hypothetical protein
MWLGKGHSVLSVFIETEKYVYGWAVDGYYNYFSFYKDGQKILHFGIYGEKANQWVTLTMRKEGNKISLYYNGQIENTYNEADTVSSQVTGVEMISPWQGDAKYNYIIVGDSTTLGLPTAPTSSNGGFPMIPVLIGGGIAVVLIGGAVYYFVFAGGSAGAGAGVSAIPGAGGAGIGAEVNAVTDTAAQAEAEAQVQGQAAVQGLQAEVQTLSQAFAQAHPNRRYNRCEHERFSP